MKLPNFFGSTVCMFSVLMMPFTHATATTTYFDGVYVGANITRAWAVSNYQTRPNCSSTSFSVFCTEGSVSAINGSVVAESGTGKHSINLFSGGVQLGRNWQSNRLVLGAEVDFSSFGFKKTTQEVGNFPSTFLGNQHELSQSISANWLVTARGRLGMTTNPGLLLYSTAGAAFTNVNMTSSYSDNAIGYGFPGGFGANGVSNTKIGWAVGGGSEWYVLKQLSIKMEYLYVDFGSSRMSIPLSNTAQYTQVMGYQADLKASLLRVGLNYQFG